MVTFYKIIIPTRDMYQSIQDAYSQTQPHYSATWLGLGCPCSNLTFEFTSAHQFIVWLILSI